MQAQVQRKAGSKGKRGAQHHVSVLYAPVPASSEAHSSA